MKTIYLDMDGVLSDFEKRYVELFGYGCAEAREKKQTIFRQHWLDIVNGWHFATLDWFPGAKDLLEYVTSLKKIELRILTSTAGYEFHYEITKQKVKWVTDRNIDIPVITVPGKRFKKLWANENSLLVDDTAKNIDDFFNNGGNAILHVSAEDTIKKMKEYLK